MQQETPYLKARRRYTIIHSGVVLTLFVFAGSGVFFIPLEAGWRIGYALVATAAIVVGILLSRWWVLQNMNALIRRMREAEEKSQGS